MDSPAPQDPSEERESFSEAEAALLEFLAQRSRAGGLDFEAFCAGRPELAEELRRLQAELEGLDRLVASARPTAPGELPELLAQAGPQGARYEVRGELAHGGMGVVLEVWEENLRRELAMKVVRERPQDTGSRRERRVARFLSEARITGQLQHPGIVPVHELGLTADRRAYFTMPRVRGLEFREILRRARAGEDRWTLQRALGVLIKVCEAVAFAHSKGVLHRDLKPANVMVGAFGETYVMDWGLARVLGTEDGIDIRLELPGPEDPAARHPGGYPPLVTLEGDVIGTPAYMPPEQARGMVSQLDRRADIYSIGAMLYELLTGWPPYSRGERPPPPGEVLNALLAGPPEPIVQLAPDAPPELADVCAKAMARDPAARYDSALELARELEAFLGSRPVAAHEAGLGYLLRLAYRRNRGVFLTVAAALVLLLASALVYLRGIQRERGRTLRLADAAHAQLLASAAPELYPGVPGVSSRLAAWVEQADRILARAPRHRATLEADPDDPVLATAAAAFDELARLRPEMAERSQRARDLPRITLEEPAAAWARARAAIAASPRYGGLDLSQQLGLVPLREDPGTGLWEFWLPLSGAAPEIDPATERIVPTSEMAVVFVLCPGGTLVLDGGRWGTREGRRVEVPPLFAGKYEVTLAQWRRVMDPVHVSYAAKIADFAVSDRHPVETVSWFDAMEYARRLGCSLPSEPEWEYLARAGSAGQWAWIGEPQQLGKFANIGDISGAAIISYEMTAPWDDGFAIHAPIGSFEPSPFALHDVLGNVSEWCRSGWRENEPPDGPGGRPVHRGASWYHSPKDSDFEFREAMEPTAAEFSRGLRLTRDVAPERG